MGRDPRLRGELSTLVIWNPNAGRVAQAAPIKERLRARGNTMIGEPRHEQEVPEMVHRGIEAGARLVVAAGGDGTVNTVLNAIVASAQDVSLAVLPLGTANDWCASLAIPNWLPAAVDLLDQGRHRALDLIEVKTAAERRLYANMAAGGNGERVSEALTEDIKRRWGALCYMRGAIDVLSHLETYALKIAFDDQPPQHFNAWSVLVANGRTSGGRVEVAPHAKLDDGLMDVVVIRGGTILDVASLTARLALSDYTQAEQVYYRKAKKIAIEACSTMRFAVDGDVLSATPTEFRVLPAVQSVIVGPTYPHPID
jgi:diacylglycerol kinase (ATP)